MIVLLLSLLLLNLLQVTLEETFVFEDHTMKSEIGVREKMAVYVVDWKNAVLDKVYILFYFILIALCVHFYEKLISVVKSSIDFLNSVRTCCRRRTGYIPLEPLPMPADIEKMHNRRRTLEFDARHNQSTFGITEEEEIYKLAYISSIKEQMDRDDNDFDNRFNGVTATGLNTSVVILLIFF